MNQQEMRGIVTLWAAILLLTPALAGRAAAAPISDLVGTWEFQVSFVNCDTGAPLGPAFSAMHTYNRGGTMLDQSNTVGPPPSAMRTVGLGVWQREGGRSYRSKFKFFTLDGASAPLGRIEVDETLELARGGDELTAVAVGAVYNAAGDLVASNCTVAAGARVVLSD